MKILVISHKRFGKDTFCEIVQKHFGIKFVSSSDFMNKKLIFPRLKDKYGYKTLKECYEDRVNHREEWYELIREYNKDDQTRLAREILEENDIYCGMRCGVQLEASKHLFDLVVWIEAEDRVGQIESGDSMTISKEQADLIITNNGTEKEFEEKVVKVMGLFLPKGLESRKEEFGKEVEKFLEKGVDRQTLLDFYYYWSEHSKNGRKMRFEKEKTFDINRRLVTWMRNNKKFSIANMIVSKKKR